MPQRRLPPWLLRRRSASRDARARHLAVILLCPFVAGYIRRHLEYADLVPPDDRARLLTR
jgi:hypothetical protein